MKFRHQLLSLTMYFVGDLNINLLDPTAIEHDFINNCHSNSLITLINKPTAMPTTIQVFYIIYGQIRTIHSMVYFH